jgi:Animal haem peroxidase
MATTDVHTEAVNQANLNAIRLKVVQPHSELPLGSVLTALMKHGGLHTLLDRDMMAARLAPLMQDATTPTPQTMLTQVQTTVESFFYRLSPNKGYTINSDLMSFITFPHDGAVYEDKPHVNPTIPAPFTFVGQFIDHDLTMNAVNLTQDQSGVILDNASPIIDLDSVYGPRATLANAPPGAIFDGTGRFKLRKIGKNQYDLTRAAPDPVTGLESAFILDARNDENQLILQVHILVIRVHNKLVKTMSAQLAGKSEGDVINAVRHEVVKNWQSVVLHDYLPRIIEKRTLNFVLREIAKPDYGDLKHKPYRDLVNHKNVVRMPHEFSIGFRFGHSQLRPEYRLNSGDPVLLFNNRRVGQRDDLRGSRKLSKQHVIDWDIFYPAKPTAEHLSLLIDGKVTPPVFDLPETAIPDDIKYVGNLPQRNLIRSRTIGVVSGEELAELYGITPLAPADVVDAKKYPEAKALFSHDGGFKTPLWYYILKEAEKGGGHTLGPLGSRLVAEVLAGALYYGDDFRFDAQWKSTITNSNKVTLRDLIDFVKE